MERAGVAHANTARPERGCGPKPNGLRGFVSRREWCDGLRRSGDRAETSAYLAGIGQDHGDHHAYGGQPKRPSLPHCGRALPRDIAQRSAHPQDNPDVAACPNRLGRRQSAKWDDGDGLGVIHPNGMNLANQTASARDLGEGQRQICQGLKSDAAQRSSTGAR